MEAQTIAIAIISPIASFSLAVIAGAVGWGKLRTKLDNLETENKKLTASNGRTVYVTRTECAGDQNKIVTEIASLVKRIDDRDGKQDEKWDMVLLHMGKVQQFMEVKK